MQTKPEGYRTVAELAKFCGVSARTIERWWKAGHIPETAVLENGTKVWSPEDARRAFEHRKLSFDSLIATGRRIR